VASIAVVNFDGCELGVLQEKHAGTTWNLGTVLEFA
jgi:hypothetical protein